MKSHLRILAFIIMLTIVLFNVNVSCAQSLNFIQVFIDNEEVKFTDSEPFINDNGFTMIPIRAVAEAFKAQVDWNESYRMVILKNDSFELRFRANSLEEVIIVTDLKFNKVKELKMPSLPVIINERTYVPLRVISEAFGYKVNWDEKNRRIDISTNYLSEVFKRNPALSDNTYTCANDCQNEITVIKQYQAIENSLQACNLLLFEAESYIKAIGEVNYKNITETEKRYGSSVEEYNMFKNVPIKAKELEQKVQIYENAVNNSMIRNVQFMAGIDNVKFENSVYPRKAIITGKLKFRYLTPTKKEYLNSYRQQIEEGKWYITDIVVCFGYARGAGMPYVDKIILGDDWAIANE